MPGLGPFLGQRQDDEFLRLLATQRAGSTNPLFPVGTEAPLDIPRSGAPVPEIPQGSSTAGRVFGGLGQGVNLAGGILGAALALGAQQEPQPDPLQMIAARRFQREGERIARNQQGGPPRLPGVGTAFEAQQQPQENQAQQLQALTSLLGILF